MDKAGGERFMMIESSLRMWEDHKIAGIGLNRWKDNYYGEYRPEKAVEENLDKTVKENYKSENFEIINTDEKEVNFYKVISKKEKVQVGDDIAELDIDIFLVTYYPDSLALKFWNSFFHLKKNRIDRFSLTLFFTNILINLKRKLEKTKLFNYKNIEKKIAYILNEAKNKNKTMPNIAYTSDCGFHLIIWREDEIFPLKKIKFEGIEFDAPNNYDIYLKKMYYSYMDLPPKEKRIPDHYQDKELKLIKK